MKTIQDILHTVDSSLRPAEFVRQQSVADVESALHAPRSSLEHFLTLISPAASNFLEPMAQLAMQKTRNHFGNAIFLFTPMYISNYCINTCEYCGYARQFKVKRKQLSIAEIDRESQKIAEQGIRNILVLTGEHPKVTSYEYLCEALNQVKKHFASMAIEVIPLSTEQYAGAVERGVNGLTIYQEVYDRDVYYKMHKGGPKDDYDFRLLAPDRAATAGMQTIQIGALLGLSEFYSEAAKTAAHVLYLQRRFPDVEIGIGLPRIRPFSYEYQTPHIISDKQFVQLLLAYRLCFPTLGITISTREDPQFRDNILPLGVTKMSAGVSTAVGGHSEDPGAAQFEISDERSVSQFIEALQKKGFQPVLHDWNASLLAASSSSCLL